MKEYSILEIQELFDKKVLSSEVLTQGYLDRIALYDGSLNSIADLNKHAILEAKLLDEERALKGPRSLLHGIPVLIKDNVLTDDSLRTTANAVVLKDYYAPVDATIIKNIRDAGGIILGKTNCSEFAYFLSKYPDMPSGFGGLNGQVKHPYNRSIDPLGSSTGSAVSVAANLATVSIGTETNGSLMSPAKQCGIVSVKPTLGMVSRYGIIPISSFQDTAGPMTRNVIDAAIFLDIIKSVDAKDASTHMYKQKEESFAEATTKSIDGLTVGILEFENYPNTDEENTGLKEAESLLLQANVTIKRISYKAELISNFTTLIHEFKRDINAFLSNTEFHMPVQSLLEIIKFNQADPRRIPFGQSTFYAAEATSGRLVEPIYLNARKQTEIEIAKFAKLFDDENLDAMITAKISGYPPVGGFPSIIVPAKPVVDLNPQSIIFIGKPWDEAILFALAHYYETQTKKRIPPQLGDDNNGKT